jgi:hypothetical protein
MKTLLTFMMSLVLFAANAQQIQINLVPMIDNKPLSDTLTEVHVYNVNSGIKVKMVGDVMTFVGQPDNEYFFTFVRNGCESKQIYIQTNGCRMNEIYQINAKINLVKGDKNKVVKAGIMWYDEVRDNFITRHTKSLLTNPLAYIDEKATIQLRR